MDLLKMTDEENRLLPNPIYPQNLDPWNTEILRERRRINLRKIKSAKKQEARKLKKEKYRNKLRKIKHEKKQKRKRIPARVLPHVSISESRALGDNILQITYTNNENHNDNFYREVPDNLERRIQLARRGFNVVNVQFTITLQLYRSTNPEETIEWHRTNRSVEVNRHTNIKNLIRDQIEDLINTAQNANLEGSDWVISHILSLKVSIINNPRRVGGSYIETPKIIDLKKAVLNIQNKNDDECFKWCILAALFPVDSKKHPYRVTNYTKLNHNLNFSNINFPVRIKDIHKFEAQNEISINVFGYDLTSKDVQFHALHISKFNYEKVIDLLYIESEEANEDYKKPGHYALIKNFTKLTAASINANSASIVCRKCMVAHRSQEVFDKHSYYCKNLQPRCEMPKEGEILKFKNANRKQKHPIVIAADFEALLVPQEDGNSKHIPSSAAFVVDSNCVERFQLYRGENCLDQFVEGIKSVVDEFATKQQQFRVQVQMTPEDWKIHKSAQNCWICKEEFSNNEVLSAKGNLYKPKCKVIDHDHATGSYIGAAHSDCNFKRQAKKFIPIYFHNLSKYDSHMILQVINKFGTGDLNMIPKTEEEYISFSKRYTTPSGDTYELRFLDSFRLLPASLDTLSSNVLKEDKNKFRLLMKYTTEKEQEAIFWDEKVENTSEILVLDKNFDHKYKTTTSIEIKPRIKGIYPYEFTDSWEKFNHTKLLNKSDFYDNLNQKSISNQEYEQYVKVWNAIGGNLGNYSDLYLKTDVLALADVIHNFRDLGLKHYELDPVYYYTTPGYSMDAMLKMTKVNLELLSDFRMLQLIEHGMRGGISSVCGDRYVNIEGKNYITNQNIDKEDPLQEWLMYLDANNLYGYSMSEKLPTGNFKWVDDIQNLDSMIRADSYSEDQTGYILSVDLVVPKTERFENYPLAPESKDISINQLSDYSKKLLEERDNYTETEKLILDFTDKKRYTVHIKNLILYHKLGCEFKIHEAISFDQSNWLKKYIDLNTELRKKAKNEFEKDFFKLMNNSMFGKTMEAIRERVEIKLADTWAKAAYQIRKPTYDKLKIFNENLIAIHMRKSSIYFNKPVYVGFCVLELSKHLMYDTYYNKMQKIFKDVKLLYTDTDSFVIHVKDSNIYKIMQQNSDLFDFSDYPKEHILYSEKNKKVLGKFKDELNGNLMSERISLRSKMYAHKIYNSKKEDKRAKGIKKCNVKNDLSFKKYYDCLFKNENTNHEYKNFKTENHEIFTITTTKKGLSAFDSKRYYLDAVRSKPFKLEESNQFHQ